MLKQAMSMSVFFSEIFKRNFNAFSCLIKLDQNNDCFFPPFAIWTVLYIYWNSSECHTLAHSPPPSLEPRPKKSQIVHLCLGLSISPHSAGRRTNCSSIHTDKQLAICELIAIVYLTLLNVLQNKSHLCCWFIFLLSSHITALFNS